MTNNPQNEISEQLISQTQDQRTLLLESLKPIISRKLFFALEEKIKNETNVLRQLLGGHEKRAQAKEKYTQALDSRWFEQKLFSEQ